MWWQRPRYAGPAVLLLAVSVAWQPARADDDRQVRRVQRPERPIEIPPSGSARGLQPPGKPYGWRQVAFDARYLATRPARLDRRDRLHLYAIAGTTVALYLLRDEIREIVQRNRSDARGRFLERAREQGKGTFGLTAALTAYLASFATRQDRERETALLLLESMAYSSVGALAGSYVLAVERPEQGSSVQLFDTDGRGVSLDVSLAAAVIPPLRRQYLRVRPGDGRGRRFWKRTATGLLYTGAALTALQRMHDDKHWAPDVFLGFVNGLGVGKTLCRAHDETPSDASASLRLVAVPGGASLVWTRSMP